MILNLKNNLLVVFVIIFVLSFSACDSGNDKKIKKNSDVQRSNALQPDHDSVKKYGIKTHGRKSEKIDDNKTDAAIDKVIKETSDFNAALGAQYARFSYDTNRVLTAEYTNHLSNISLKKYLDFVLDFKKNVKMRGVNDEEYNLIEIMTIDKMKNAKTDKEWFLLSDIGGQIIAIAFHHDINKMGEFAVTWFDSAYEQFKRNGEFFHVTLAMSKSIWDIKDMAAQQQEDYINKLTKSYSEILMETDHSLNKRQELSVKNIIAQISHFMDPNKALEQLQSIEPEYLEVYRSNNRATEFFKLRIEGLKKGFVGKELNEFVHLNYHP